MTTKARISTWIIILYAVRIFSVRILVSSIADTECSRDIHKALPRKNR